MKTREQHLQYYCQFRHGGVPMAIGMKVESKEARPDDPVGRGEGSIFIIQLSII